MYVECWMNRFHFGFHKTKTGKYEKIKKIKQYPKISVVSNFGSTNVSTSPVRVSRGTNDLSWTSPLIIISLGVKNSIKSCEAPTTRSIEYIKCFVSYSEYYPTFWRD